MLSRRYSKHVKYRLEHFKRPAAVKKIDYSGVNRVSKTFADRFGNRSVRPYNFGLLSISLPANTFLVPIFRRIFLMSMFTGKFIGFTTYLTKRK